MISKRGRDPKFRKKVLEYLIMNGPKSPTKIHEEWTKDDQSSHKAKKPSLFAIIRALSELENGFIVKIKNGRETHCYISEKGLTHLIDTKDKNLPPEKFWIHLSHLLELGEIDEKRSFELIHDYQIKKLQVDVKYSYNNKTYSLLRKTIINSEVDKLTKIFIMLQKLSENKIIDVEKYNQITREDNPPMLEEFLDKTHDDSPLIKYALGKSGFLFMLRYNLNLYRQKIISKEKFHDETSKLIENNSFLFPLIFENSRWIKLRNLFGNKIEDILAIFDYIYLHQEDTSNDFLDYRFFVERRSSLLINSQHEMSLSYYNKLEEFWNAAKNAFEAWKNQRMLSPLSDSMLSDKILQGIFELEKYDCETIRLIDKIRVHNELISKGSESDLLAGFGEMFEDGTEKVYSEPIDENSARFKDPRLNKILDIIYDIHNVLETDAETYKKELSKVLKKYDFFQKKYLEKFIRLYKDITSFKKIKPIWESIIDELDSTGIKEGHSPYPIEKFQILQSSDASQNIISFLFYTYLAHNYHPVFSKLLTGDKKLAKWYYDWLCEIQKFEDEKRTIISDVVNEMKKFAGVD